MKKIVVLIILLILALTSCVDKKEDIKYYEVNFMYKDEVYCNTKVKENETVKKPKDPGEDFLYWSLEVEGEEFSFTTKITKNTTLYAVLYKEQDPYLNMSETEFYANYEVADSYLDSYYRTKHGFMSGVLGMPNQEPTIAKNQPKEDDIYLRNSDEAYVDDGKGWQIKDAEGNVVTTIYEGGAYISLDEVAAYLLAFGDTPANYIEDKSGNPSRNKWGEYLRLNNSYFSGDTKKYPYEPELPNIDGGSGELKYYEIDFGTTGTDCDPSYPSVIYNDGIEITRGAARLVYTRYDKYYSEISDINEKYVFYTYNHYNDFQEYLNYYGGFGEIFGNITGGGTISSRYDYNPTPYVVSKKVSFSNM